MRKPVKKKLIGSTDRIDLPELKLQDVACKIDTGAATSTLHCREIWLEEEEGEKVLCFNLYEPQFQIYSKENYCFSQFRLRKVRSSNGMMEQRYSIHTVVHLMNRKIRTEFTLSSREKMRFPILLGKRFLKNRFVVDVSLDHLNYDLKYRQ